MPVPVIVAIGHTQDKFILQDLAWYGAKTPTDAAYKIVELLETWDEGVEVLYDAIVTLAQEKLVTIRENIDQRQSNIARTLATFLQRARLSIEGRYGTIMAISPEKLLANGYALVTKDGHYLSAENAANLQTGDELEIQLYDSRFEVKITRKK